MDARKSKYDAKTVQQWVDYLNEGHSYRETGKKYGVSGDTVYGMVKKTGKVGRRIAYPRHRAVSVPATNGTSRQIYHLAAMLDKAIAAEIQSGGKITPMHRLALVLTGEIMK